MRLRIRKTKPNADATTVSRRRFLATVGAGGAAAAVTRPIGAGARGRGRTDVAYRLSPGRQGACNACMAHAANRYYRTPKAADRDRAHRGCSCAIVQHPLPRGAYARMFAGHSDVFDARWGHGHNGRGRNGR